MVWGPCWSKVVYRPILVRLATRKATAHRRTYTKCMFYWNCSYFSKGTVPYCTALLGKCRMLFGYTTCLRDLRHTLQKDSLNSVVFVWLKWFIPSALHGVKYLITRSVCCLGHQVCKDQRRKRSLIHKTGWLFIRPYCWFSSVNFHIYSVTKVTICQWEWMF